MTWRKTHTASVKRHFKSPTSDARKVTEADIDNIEKWLINYEHGQDYSDGGFMLTDGFVVDVGTQGEHSGVAYEAIHSVGIPDEAFSGNAEAFLGKHGIFRCAWGDAEFDIDVRKMPTEAQFKAVKEMIYDRDFDRVNKDVVWDIRSGEKRIQGIGSDRDFMRACHSAFDRSETS